jgi:alkylhydroperoxidase family enzyme
MATWREVSSFTDAEHATLALVESVTRLTDQAASVLDMIWDEITRHYDEMGLATLVLMISTARFFTRLGTAPQQIADATKQEGEYAH